MKAQKRQGGGGGSTSLSDYGEEVAETSHLSTLDIDTSDFEDTIYGNSSYCILTPESEVGPFCTLAICF